MIFGFEAFPNYKRSLVSLLPHTAEGGCTRNGIRQVLLCLRQNRTCLRSLCSTAYYQRTAPLVPLASLDLPNRGRRVACGSFAPGPVPGFISYFVGIVSREGQVEAELTG